MEHQDADFAPIGRTRMDDRRRVVLGKTSGTVGQTYSVFERADGAILLKPVSAPSIKEKPDA
jgi:hypothetical protein